VSGHSEGGVSFRAKGVNEQLIDMLICVQQLQVTPVLVVLVDLQQGGGNVLWAGEVSAQW
jgi:hypothetical protein